MQSVTIIGEDGTRSKAYLEGANEADKSKQVLKERLYTVYLLVAITAFSFAIYTHITKKK